MLKKSLGVLGRMANNIKILERHAAAQALKEAHAAAIKEPLSERDFVRGFGAKAVFVRLSKRTDFVGLIICGMNSGIMIVQHGDMRRVRIIDVEPCPDQIHGRRKVTNRYFPVNHDDSVSNMLPALRKYVS